MRKLKCLILAFIIAVSTVVIAGAETSDSTEDMDLSDFLFDDTSSDISTVTPDLSEMILVDESEKLCLYFYKSGMDIYILNKDTGKLWSNVLMNDYVANEDFAPSIVSQFLTVSVADTSNSVSNFVLYDDSNTDITAMHSVVDGELILDVNISSFDIAFSLSMGIEGDTFYYSLPDDSVKESGDGKIIDISLFNNLGASRFDEQGYIFYPDGSGSLMNFEPNDEGNAKLHQFSFYGSSDVNYLQLERNDEYNLYGALLPVWGVSQKNGGFIAYVDSGAEDTTLNLAEPGYQLSKVYRAYSTYTYRKYSSTSFNGADVTALVSERNCSDISVHYSFIDDDDNNYSGMAVRYRNYLEQKGILKKKDNSDELPLNIKMLCGVQKETLLSSSVLAMTDFSEAREIISRLKNSDISNLDVVLSGWNKGGWDVLPTAYKAESKLGGKTELNRLIKSCKEENVELTLDVDAILANKDTGTFNQRKDAVRNHYGEAYTDKTSKKYILNACNVMKDLISEFEPFSDAGINLLSVGKIVFPDYKNGEVSTRGEVVEAYESAMKKLKEDGVKIGVATGNSYVLPYADIIYELPQTDSGYVSSDGSVPFYQMVIHGYIPYTGTYGNTHYSYEKCVLEWVEYGCSPAFLLTWEDTSKLKETNYNSVFSSEFSEWQQRITETYDRFKTDFKDILGETIDSHKKVAEDVYCLQYSNGIKVYVNYNEESVTVDGITVSGLDYLITGE